MTDAGLPRLVVFDCDGTLVDSQHMIVAAMEATFASQDYAFPGREATLSIVGLSLAEAFRHLLPEAGQAALSGWRDAAETRIAATAAAADLAQQLEQN